MLWGSSKQNKNWCKKKTLHDAGAHTHTRHHWLLFLCPTQPQETNLSVLPKKIFGICLVLDFSTVSLYSKPPYSPSRTTHDLQKHCLLPLGSTPAGCDDRYMALHQPPLETQSTWVPWWCSSKESTCQSRGHRFDPWSGNIPHATGQLIPRAPTPEARVPWKLCSTREATAMRSPPTTTREKLEQQRRPSTAKNK